MKTTFALASLVVVLAAASAHATGVSIDLEVRAPGFDVDALRGHLSIDLGESVTAPTIEASAHLLVTESNGKIIVGITQGDRQVTREIELPPDHAVAEETLELVLAAMARTEMARSPVVQNGSTRESMPAVTAVALTRVAVAPSHVDDERVIPFGIDFLPFVGVSSALRGRDTRYVSFGAIGTLSRSIRGLEIAGVVGVSRESFGVQIAGVANVVAKDASGLQIGGVVSVTGGALHGAQIGGVVNVAKDVDGMQLGGVVNIANGDVAGAQIGGLVNIATGHVRGLQLGLVNIAEDSDAPIGLFNIIKNGRHHIDVWGQETGLVMGGAQLGGKYTHAIIGAGVRPGPDGARFAYGGGIGFHVDLSQGVGIDFDVLHHDLAAFFSPAKLVQLSQARVLLNFEVVRGFRIIAGPTFNVLVSNEQTDQNPSIFGSWTASHGGNTHVALWPGITIGSRLL